MAAGSSNEYPSVLIKEGAVPTNPPAGDQRVYIDNVDHKFKRVNSSGTVTIIEGGGGGGFAPSWVTKTANYTLSTSDTSILADATSAALTITLPTAVGNTNQFAIKKKDGSANLVTIATTSSQTVDGTTTKTLRVKNDTIIVESDGSNWYIAGALWNDAVQLDYAASTDIANALTVPATTWTDIGTNQTFTVDDANSLIEISVGGCVRLGVANAGAQIVIDSAGTPTNKLLGGVGGSTGGNVLAGAGLVTLGAILAAGSHTIKLQVWSNGGDTAYCRASSFPNFEGLTFRILERKR